MSPPLPSTSPAARQVFLRQVWQQVFTFSKKSPALRDKNLHPNHHAYFQLIRVCGHLISSHHELSRSALHQKQRPGPWKHIFLSQLLERGNWGYIHSGSQPLKSQQKSAKQFAFIYAPKDLSKWWNLFVFFFFSVFLIFNMTIKSICCFF